MLCIVLKLDSSLGVYNRELRCDVGISPGSDAGRELEDRV